MLACAAVSSWVARITPLPATKLTRALAAITVLVRSPLD